MSLYQTLVLLYVTVRHFPCIALDHRLRILETWAHSLSLKPTGRLQTAGLRYEL